MRAIQQFTSSVLADVIRRQPPSPGRTTLAWQVAVGARIARATSVELREGVLIVTADDPRWMADVDGARGVVLGRLKQLLGPDAVRTIRIEAATARRG